MIHKKERIDMYSFFAIFKIFFLGGGEGGGGRGEGEGIILMDQGKEKVCSLRHSLHLSCLNSSQG